jgi:pimeloyl-ACP methyl ester carboxylesterase
MASASRSFAPPTYPIMDRPNLTVLTDAFVRRVIIRGKRATGVEVSLRGQVRQFVASTEMVLALGARPWYTVDLAFLRGMWRLWYQFPITLPIVGPRIIGDRRGRFPLMLSRWLGAGFVPADLPMYVRVMAERDHADAGSRWYRTAQLLEIPRWLLGRYDHCRINVPVRMLHGTQDPVITATLLRGYSDRLRDFEIETVGGVGHWIVEQQPKLVLNRLQAFLAAA